jgi:hypothetical protein
MTLIDVAITKGASADAVEIGRPAGGPARFTFPKKGPIPHDSVHLIVEQALGFKRGFWGMVADGVDPGQIQEIAKAAGHASAKRAQIPDPSIVELIQAERIVECFEADLWGAPTDCDTFRSVADAACSESFVPTPALSDDSILAIRDQIAEFAKQWIAAPVGTRFDLRYHAPD